MTAVDTVESEFDHFAEDYHSVCNHGLALSGETKTYFARKRLEWLADWLLRREAASPEYIIDFGCGVGDVTAMIASQYPRAEVIGVDISRRSLERARREHGSQRVHFLHADDQAVEEASADLLHCNGVIHHVPPQERRATMTKMVSQLRPAGHVCVFENNPWNPGTRWVMHRVPFDRDAKAIGPGGLRSLMRDGGAEIRETAFLFYFPRLLKRLRVLEPSLVHVPLGAQYAVVGQAALPVSPKLQACDEVAVPC